ncbi:hypothetical protein [Vulgatibacter incomptus]|uniref:Uncharacterized protein n=1 Tax=Vulgatibacter incomptus TaxID=1391653 RepID=A0A0K1P8U5_9BACT|nr:hypothetical protein [Vulgatibacter incomptus]AKU89831.1 hypothetical protein AKJ08_0218 [Vulgatibacter incomptus]
MVPFAVRLRAHAAGLEAEASRVLGGGRSAEDLLALAGGPLPLIAAAASAVAPREASVVGLLPVELVGDADAVARRALAHRAAAEAEVLELSAGEGCTVDTACQAVKALLANLRGATARIDEASLRALASASGITEGEAASRLAEAGVAELVAVSPGDAPTVNGLAVRLLVVVPARIDLDFVAALLGRRPGPLAMVAGADTTGVMLLRAVAIARLAGHGPIAVGGKDELKGPDACLAFGADRLEAELDPPGSMGSRTRSYGEAAVRGAQLVLAAPRRRAAAGKKIAHILDEQVDPSLLPGGDALAVPLEVRS